MLTTIMDRYKFLCDFIETKITCALILNMMNTNHAMSDINPSGLVVSPLSVESELDNLKVAHELGGVAVVNFNKRKYQQNEKKRTRRYLHLRTKILQHFALFNNFTIVQHTVGFHRDSFKKRTVTIFEKDGNVVSKEEKQDIYCLGNKLCFCNPSLFNTYGIGRGSAGGGQFVFALLDWQYARGGRRRRAVHATINNPPARVTRCYWEEVFAVQHPAAAAAVGQS